VVNAGKLVLLAQESKKSSQGDWELIFSDEDWEKINLDPEVNLEDSLEVHSHNESLESFFFNNVGKTD